MTLSDIGKIFNRAWSQTFDKRKLFLMFIVLLFCGLLVVFFHGLSIGANPWIKQSLTFLPFFLCAGVLLSTGIMLIRVYHDEIKQKPVSYQEVFSKSWEIIIGSSYFSIPIILCYLLLWVLTGIFLLFEQTPIVGPTFSTILAFGPFLLNLAAILLCIANVSMLFFAAPVLALKGLNGIRISKNLTQKYNKDIFSNLLLGFIAITPLALVLIILTLAGIMSGLSTLQYSSILFSTLRRFIIMIPFVAFLTPPLIFFFNFSAESHVILLKEVKKQTLQ